MESECDIMQQSNGRGKKLTRCLGFVAFYVGNPLLQMQGEGVSGNNDGVPVPHVAIAIVLMILFRSSKRAPDATGWTAKDQGRIGWLSREPAATSEMPRHRRRIMAVKQ